MQQFAKTGNSPQSPAVTAMPAVVRKIADALHPQAIIVFGSVARGTAGPNSDIDLLVVDDFEAAGRTQDESLDLLYKAIWGFLVAIDPIVVAPTDFARWRDSPYNVIGVCAREGRVVYGSI